MAERRKSRKKRADDEETSRPLGVGIGAAGGAATGAAIGSVAGPAGTVVGAAIGGIAGGLAGRAVSQALDPEAEDRYWREHYGARPYVAPGADYATYQPAYRYGWESYARHGERPFDDVQADLEREWQQARGESTLSWPEAHGAVRDAWQRVRRSTDETLDPRQEDRFWRENYASRPYVDPAARYEDWAPAFRYGWLSYDRHAGRTFEEAEAELARDWAHHRGGSPLGWERAREAVRDVWQRLERALPGGAGGGR